MKCDKGVEFLKSGHDLKHYIRVPGNPWHFHYASIHPMPSSHRGLLCLLACSPVGLFPSLINYNPDIKPYRLLCSKYVTKKIYMPSTKKLCQLVLEKNYICTLQLPLVITFATYMFLASKFLLVQLTLAFCQK